MLTVCYISLNKNMLNLFIQTVFSLCVWIIFPSITTKDLNIVFWIDPVQKSFYEDVNHVLTAVRDLHLKIRISDAVLEIPSFNQESDEEFRSNDENMIQFCEILQSEGASIVFDFSYQPWQQGLTYVHKYNIPYIRVDRLLSPFVDMFMKYLLEKNANDAAIIVTNKEDETSLLLDVLDGLPIRVALLNYNNNENPKFIQYLGSMRPSPSYYGIIADGINMKTVFEELQTGDVFKRPAEWHFIFLDSKHQTFKYQKSVENSTQFIIDVEDLCRKMHLREFYCERDFNRAVLLEIFRGLIDINHSEPNVLKPVYQTCETPFAKEHENSNIIQPQNDFNIIDHLLLSDFLTTMTRYQNFLPNIYYSEINTLITFTFNATIKLIAEGENSNSDMAIWQADRLLKNNPTITPAKRFFRIGTAEAIPWSYYVRDPQTGSIKLDENGKPIWEGFCIDLIEALAEKLDVHYELVAPTKGAFGEKDEKTGEWDGLVGDLVSGEIEIAVGALKMYSEREEVIDFISPYFESTGISIVMRKPMQIRSLFKFMSVLKPEVWLSIAAAVFATAVLMWIIEKYSPYSSRNNSSNTSSKHSYRVFTLKECLWFTLSSFTPQGGGETPKSISGRILVASYWLFVVLILATFTANLAAFLTVERMQTPVQSLEQLGKQSRISYTVVHESDTHQYFINMKYAEDILHQMWNELVLNASKDSYKFRIWDYPIKEQYGRLLLAINNSNPVKDATEGFRKVNDYEKGDFAFIHDSAEIKFELTRNCNLTEVGEAFAKQSYAIAVQQGSQLQDELCYALIELQQNRFLNDLKLKYWNQSRCPHNDAESGISLESVGGVFIAASAGLILAAIVMVFEVYYYKKNDNLSFEKKITQVQAVNSKLETIFALKNEFKMKNFHRSPPPSFDVTHYASNKTITTGKISRIRRLEFQENKRLQITRNLHHTFKNRNRLLPYID